jgi:hypothetical protein
LSAIYLSASVPTINRGTYHETANTILIDSAVSAFLIAVNKKYQIVCGGDPALTRKLLTISKDLNLQNASALILYQSAFFHDANAKKNLQFENLILTNAVMGNREASLIRMRRQMLSRPDLLGAVFIGGMDGVEKEHQMLRHYHPHIKVLPVTSPGGGALNLAFDHGYKSGEDFDNTDFKSIFQEYLSQLSIQ